MRRHYSEDTRNYVVESLNLNRILNKDPRATLAEHQRLEVCYLILSDIRSMEHLADIQEEVTSLHKSLVPSGEFLRSMRKHIEEFTSFCVRGNQLPRDFLIENLITNYRLGTLAYFKKEIDELLYLYADDWIWDARNQALACSSIDSQIDDARWGA